MGGMENGTASAQQKQENQQQQLLLLQQRIAKIMDEVKSSNATHIRKHKELSTLRSKSPTLHQFTSAFTKTLTPIFLIQRRIPSADRIVRFVSAFATTPHSNSNENDNFQFLEEFLKFLLVAAAAANRTARLKACQIISEIIMRLPDDAQVNDEIWDDVIDSMKLRVGDKIPAIRSFAIRALSRFVNDAENSDILDLFLEVLPLEQNVEVRKTIVLALPPTNATSAAIIDRTMDVSESVRKAAYCVLAKKFPLQSLSIKQRTLVLQRGLSDRSAAVSMECLKLVKDEWLPKSCNNDPIELLKYLDVETYELVGESIMRALLKDGLVNLREHQSIQEYTWKSTDANEEDCTPSIQLMEPEFALYLNSVCRHLQAEAQAKGSDAAATMGTEAAVYAAEASDNNELLEKILPATVSDYVLLIRAHIDAGASHRFASRQLLLLGSMLDFSDSTSRKNASAFIQDLLHKPLDHEVDDDGNKVVIGDGINLGGDRDWADAVSYLAKKVYAATGEFEEVVLGVVEELAQPCRERTADFLHWMHTLAVTGLLLENAISFRWMQGKAIEPAELLQALLLPGAKHAHLDVQRVALRCLGLFGLLEKNPGEELLKQLRLSFASGPAFISIVACKALVDLCMWHGPQAVDRALGEDCVYQFLDGKAILSSVDFCDAEENLRVPLLGLLYAGFDRNDWEGPLENDENESVQAVLGEGFAKVLLLSENYQNIPHCLHSLLLAKLIKSYFSSDKKDLQRLKQCLSVFFEHYPSLSSNHKKYLSEAFVPVIRSMWPGINGNAGGSSTVVSNMRKRAVQASRFMLQMMQAPLYAKATEPEDENGSIELSETSNSSLQLPLECGEEGLAIRIAAEVASFDTKKSPAEKSYISALCKILVCLHFRASEQGAIKLMSRLLTSVAKSVTADKELVKELKQMAEHLKSVDAHPDQELLPDQVDLISGRLELDINLDVDSFAAAMPQTPAPPPSTRRSRPRRRVRNDDSSDEEDSPTYVAQPVPSSVGPRSQRASKTAALSKMTAVKTTRIDEYDEEGNSEVTQSENSDDSDDYTSSD